MDQETLLAVMSEDAGWTTEQLLQRTGETPESVNAALSELQAQGLVVRSPKGNWRAKGAPASGLSVSNETWGRRTRMLIYSPEILAACPEFTRNTFLHFVEDEDHHFRLRDYVDGKRIEVKSVNGITLSKELADAYPRFELEFDDEEEHTPLTDNAFWQRRLAAHNASHAALLAKANG